MTNKAELRPVKRSVFVSDPWVRPFGASFGPQLFADSSTLMDPIKIQAEIHDSVNADHSKLVAHIRDKQVLKGLNHRPFEIAEVEHCLKGGENSNISFNIDQEDLMKSQRDYGS